jgi:hypothetical protein
MPADVSFENVRPSRAPAQTRVRSHTGRLPLGLGLAIAACASGGLWVAAFAGVHALLT